MKFTFLLVAQSILALASSPSGGYAPAQITCPDKDILRDATGLNADESKWLDNRNPITKDKIANFLKSSNIDIDVDNYMSKIDDTIKIGIAFSGGGYRAMLNGAGQMLALDDRFDNATEHGLGGLLQCSTYLTGLSGGSWLVGSVVLNNYTTIWDIVNKRQIWDLQNGIVNYGGWNVLETAEYYREIFGQLCDKRNAGFDLSITDIWGRALSYQFFSTEPEGGVALLWSDIRDVELFKTHQMPFPIIAANGRTPDSVIINLNSTNVEIGPYELGSWDPSLYQFADTKYIGSKLINGKPANSTCYGGFDNAGFAVGTSSSLFNAWVTQLEGIALPPVIDDVINPIFNLVNNIDLATSEDIALYKPNPFYKTNEGTSKSISESETLYLCDGGLDLQNVPLQPLIQEYRGVDVIFAYDNSADTDVNWPNGSSLVATYERQFSWLSSQGNSTAFPYVPDETTFRNLNLTARPTFFGCDASNLTTLDSGNSFIPPLVVYTANRPFSYWSNTSTFQLNYSDEEKRGIIRNGFEVASRLNSTLDADWKTCVSCAIIRRSQERLGEQQSDACQKCFQEYCWNGDIDNSKIPGDNFTKTGITSGEDTSHEGLN